MEGAAFKFRAFDAAEEYGVCDEIDWSECMGFFSFIMGAIPALISTFSRSTRGKLIGLVPGSKLVGLLDSS